MKVHAVFNLRIKLIVLFLLISTIPIAIIAYFNFSSPIGRKALEDARIENLQSIAVLKADKITAFFKNIEQDIKIAQNYLNVRKNFPIVSGYIHNRSNPDYRIAVKELDSQLIPLQRFRQFDDVMLINPEGIIVYATNKAYRYQTLGSSLSDLVSKRVAEGQKGLFISDIFRDVLKGSNFDMVLMAPIFSLKGETLGSVAFEIDMDPVFAIMQDTTGLGMTGETLLGKNMGDHVLFLNPLRHDYEAALNRKVKLGDPLELALQKAAQGESGFGESLDYRGEKVLAVWQYIPELDWGLVSKIDTAEIYGPIRVLQRTILITALFTSVITIILSFIFGRKFSSPIIRITKALDDFREGKSDIKLAGQIVQSSDEIGNLARGFNKLVEDFQKITVSRDELVKEVDRRKVIEQDLVNQKRAALTIMEDADLARELVQKAKNKLEETAAELARSNEELNAFAYTISHDLRAPLRTIQSFSNLVKKKNQDNLDKASLEDLDRVISNSQKMNNMMEDILEFSRIGRTEESKENVDLNTLVNEVLTLMKEDIDAKKAIVNIIGELPEISCYKVRVTQIFLNLIGNSLKYTEEGTQPKITIGCTKKDDHHCFYVRDNGIGMKKEFHAKIFQIFSRLHTENSSYKGSGVGLSNVKKIIELHGGEINVESEEGKGSTFYFTLEGVSKKKLGEILLEDKVITEEQLSGALSKQEASAQSFKYNKHVLVVDDDSDCIVLFKRHLEEQKTEFKASYASSGQEAVDYIYGNGRYADRNKFPMCDVMLLDINMPGTSGFDVLAEIRKDSRFKDIPIITMYTSSNSPEDKKKALKLGANEYINKNEDFEKVFLVVQKLMNQAKDVVAAERAKNKISNREAKTNGGKKR